MMSQNKPIKTSDDKKETILLTQLNGFFDWSRTPRVVKEITSTRVVLDKYNGSEEAPFLYPNYPDIQIDEDKKDGKYTLTLTTILNTYGFTAKIQASSSWGKENPEADKHLFFWHFNFVCATWQYKSMFNKYEQDFKNEEIEFYNGEKLNLTWKKQF